MSQAPEDVQLSMTDFRRAGHCARMRGWFMDHDLYPEFKQLVRGETIPAGKVLATGDARALNVVRLKLEREARTDG